MTLVKERPVESVNDNNKDKKPQVSLKVFIPIDNVIPKFDSLKELETKILRSRQNNSNVSEASRLNQSVPGSSHPD